MNSTFETFIQAYQKAPQNIQQLIDSDAIGEFTDAITVQYSLPPATKQPLVIAISNRVLGIFSAADVIGYLQRSNLDQNTITGLNEKINTFVQTKVGGAVSVSAPATQAIPKPATLSEQAKAAPMIPISPVQPSQGVPPIRTMAGDMARSQTSGDKVYSSTQDAILKEGWSVPTPKPEPPK